MLCESFFLFDSPLLMLLLLLLLLLLPETAAADGGRGREGRKDRERPT